MTSIQDNFNEIKRVLDALESYANDERVFCFTKNIGEYRVDAKNHLDNASSQKLQNLLVKVERKLSQVIIKIDDLERNICISDKDDWHESGTNKSMKDYMWHEIEKTNLDLFKASFSKAELKEIEPEYLALIEEFKNEKDL